MVKAYTPLSSDIPPYTLPVQPSENVIEKDREFFLKSARYTSNDGAMHVVTLYTVPEGQVLFIEKAAISAYANDYVAGATAGYVHLTALGLYIAAVELASGSSAEMVNIYPTPVKLLAGDNISVVYYQPTNLKPIATTVIVSGYLLSNF
jgi:hypothetical protein